MAYVLEIVGHPKLTDGIIKITRVPGDPEEVSVSQVKSQLDLMVATKVLSGGRIIRVRGEEVSLGVAIVIGKALTPVYDAIAWYDPRSGEYIVAVSRTNQYKIGDIVRV